MIFLTSMMGKHGITFMFLENLAAFTVVKTPQHDIDDGDIIVQPPAETVDENTNINVSVDNSINENTNINDSVDNSINEALDHSPLMHRD